MPIGPLRFTLPVAFTLESVLELAAGNLNLPDNTSTTLTNAIAAMRQGSPADSYDSCNPNDPY
jgi:hypothetical protein